MIFKIHSGAVKSKPALTPEQNWAKCLMFCHFAFLPKVPCNHRVMSVQVFSKLCSGAMRCTSTSLY